jgi:hypothetical protein
MTYYLLQFNGFQAYQEIEGGGGGNVTRYVNLDGTTAFIIPPEGDGGTIIDLNPPHLDWML